jgi:protein-S-isoprenylcysteine O-methyltransferase Ste14
LKPPPTGNMENILSRWGVGPRIVSLALPYGIVAGIATRIWLHVCRLRFIPGIVLVTLAAVFLAAGLTMLLIAVISMNRAYNSDRLLTLGIFAVVRHPIYSAWVVLILPGLALLSRSWPLLLMPIVAYTVVKLTIHREDEYLQQRFGQAYPDYRSRVNKLFPFPRFSPT